MKKKSQHNEDQQTSMNRLVKPGLLAVGIALASQGAYAGPNNNDLILNINFNSGTPAGATEFNANLGLNSVVAALPANSDLSSSLAGFSGYASAGQSGLNVGVFGGQNGQGGLSGTGNDVFWTTLRTAANPNNIPGSSAPTAGNPSKSAIGTAGGVGAGFTAYGNAISVSDPSSFTVNVAGTPTALGTAGNAIGASPLSTMTGSKIVLDLWADTVTSSSTTSGWVYEGNLTLDLSNPSSPTLTFDATAVPEPTTYGLIAGAGLLLVSLRRQFSKTV